ncbi:DUF2267 domain-containing protein [Sulfitobacter sp. S190]|uniref:DUF2267 domain-containing protein n=1 Tax=Sulfitobacter sp. S190 TaxID=2867022 RepID=UPI0021A61BF6|nr:DUF2267 domain-containing protein [Sulfitobacter sp. S190]UWR21837.1 DUF2267 domain-containing protein [Sulfitobacter sp. S190]
MTTQGLEVIDHTVHLTHEWINELARRLEYASHRTSLRLLRVVLHRIRDHLSVDEAAQLSAQLPVMIRGFFFEGWVPKVTPIKERRGEDFVSFIHKQMDQTRDFRGVADITCVFDLLNARISRGEIEDVRARLPEYLRAMWPPP